MNKWLPEPNEHLLRRLGKTCEEANELGAVCARAAIQGLDQVDPASGKTNRQRFLEEMADVEAQIASNFSAWVLTQEELFAYYDRVRMKRSQMSDWEAHYHEASK